MKKLLTFSMIAIISSCNTQKSKTIQKESVIDSNAIMVDSAKYYIDRSNEFVIKGMKNEIKKSKANDSVKLYMGKYFLLHKKLQPSDTLLLMDYRIKKINEIIDLKMK